MLQQVISAAVVACLPVEPHSVAHTPRADVAHRPGAEAVVPADLAVPLSLDLAQVRVPLVIDVLRSRHSARRPLQGEVALGTLDITNQGVRFTDARGTHQLGPTCLPAPSAPAERPAPRLEPAPPR